MSEIQIRTRDLSIGYGRHVVRDVSDLTLGPGSVWLVTGPNGSGKSTLLRTLAGLLPPLRGSVEPKLPAGGGGAVFVHSTPVLFRGSLKSNLSVPDASMTAVHQAAATFGLSAQLNERAHQLSHGMRQRAALARAVLARPALLLLDEPEGGLDAAALDQWRAFAARTVAERQMVLVVAAHRPAGLEGFPVGVIELT
jgi:ABC-type multidrug transport system ATPase subunit